MGRRTSADGYADSIECAINLHNRELVKGVDLSGSTARCR